MESKKTTFWQRLTGRGQVTETVQAQVELPDPERVSSETLPLDIPPHDPLLAYFLSAPGVVEVDKLKLDSPTLEALRAGGIKLTLPLVSQGELIGLLNLGQRLSEQEYSSDDFRLLNNLATQAAPALRIAQLARQQLAEAQERERMAHELRVARVIQETLLPRELPALPGWQVAAHWKPAREVGGDFYDFIALPDDRLGIVIADVTDKGVPAAMVMATTRTLLRAVAERLIDPGQVLERVNNLLVPDIPQNMFVTCNYVVLDPATGKICFANAGHNLPYHQTQNGVVEQRVTGMPLGLMPEMSYDEIEIVLEPGDSLLLTSDGLVEAHNPQGEMFGFASLQSLLTGHHGGAEVIEYLLDQFKSFTGPDYEQEDDITLLILEREALPSMGESVVRGDSTLLAEFSIPSQPGNERQAADRVSETVASLNLTRLNLDRIKTAVAEATMNAMEHGNKYQADKPVLVQVLISEAHLTVRITDQGGGQEIPPAQTPDIDAKLAGNQSPRGWGLFLIKNMVDEMNVSSDDRHHTIELIVKLKGDNHGKSTL